MITNLDFETTISDFADDLINSLNFFNDILEENKIKIIYRKYRKNGKIYKNMLISDNFLLYNSIPFSFAIRNLNRFIKSRKVVI